MTLYPLGEPLTPGTVASVTAGDASMFINPTFGNVVVKVAELSGTNAKLGTFPFTITAGAKGDLLYNNGTDWVNLHVGATGLVLSPVAGIPAWTTLTGVSVTSVTNSDSTLTISPTTGAVVASLNLGHSNAWNVDQSFNTNVVVGAAGSHSPPYALTIGGAGRTVSIGGTSYPTKFQTHQEGNDIVVDVGLGRHSNTAGVSGNLYMLRSEGTEATPLIVAAGDDLGTVHVLGYDGATYQPSFYIDAVVSGTVATGIVPATVTLAVTDNTGTANALLVLNGPGKIIASDADASQLWGQSSHTTYPFVELGTQSATAGYINLTDGTNGGTLTFRPFSVGYGIQASVPLWTQPPLFTGATTPYTVAGYDEVLPVTTGASAFSVLLPAASALKGRKLLIIKADSGAGAITITPNGGDTVEGASTLVISAQYGKAGLISDGTATWYDLGSGGV